MACNKSPALLALLVSVACACSSSKVGGGAASNVAGTGAVSPAESDAGTPASGGGNGGTFGESGGIGGGGMGEDAGLSPMAGGSANGPAGGGGGTTDPAEPSGMPMPNRSALLKPSGRPGGLTVLDWAGFKAAISFTFDDALSSQIANYAALRETGVHLTFYLVSNNNGTNATWSQAANDGNELGNHTAHHCGAGGMECIWGTYAGSIGAELDECSAHIEQQFGVKDVWTAAAPYGDTGYEAVDSTRFLLNRGVQAGAVAANDSTSPFALPCHMAAQGEQAGTFNASTDAARAAGKWQIFLIHSLGGDGGYNPISIVDAVAAINHAKSQVDTWTDSMVQVGAYWRAQKLVSGITPTASGATTTWVWTLPAHFPPNHYLRVTVSGGTLSQYGQALPWSEHGYYEVALDAGAMTLSP